MASNDWTIVNNELEMCEVKWSEVKVLNVDGKVKKGKAIPVTGREGPQGFEMSRFPYFLENTLTDGGKVVSLTRRPPFITQEDSWYSFLLEAESTPGP
jgi:hypothetical protein